MALALLSTSPVCAAPANTIADLWPALTACWHAPDGSGGSQITVVFSLTRQGAVLGKPRVSYAKLVGSPEAKRSFVAAALGALAACTPVALTPGLGGAIAGRPLSVRFVGGSSGPAI